MRKYVKFHHVKFWGSSTVQKLDAGKKLFYMYLITHPNRGTSGLIEINEIDYKKALNQTSSSPRQALVEGLTKLESNDLIVKNRGDMGLSWGVFVKKTAEFEITGKNSVHSVLNDAISRAEKDVIIPLIPAFLREYRDIILEHKDESIEEKLEKLEGVCKGLERGREGVDKGSERGETNPPIAVNKKIGKQENKKTYTYDQERSKEIKEVFNHWVEQEATISHRKLPGSMKSSINARLDDGFGVDELKEAIENYNKVVLSDEYFFNYDNWSLKEFMSRGEGEQVEKFLCNPEGFRNDESADDASNVHVDDGETAESAASKYEDAIN